MSRTRSTVYYDTSTPCSWDWYYGDPPAFAGHYVLGSQYAYKEKSIIDVVTTNYGELVRSGGFRPINPVSIFTFEKSNVPMVGRADNTSISPPAASYFVGGGDPFDWVGFTYATEYVYSNSDVDACVIKALAKAKQPDLDILTFFGELPLTVELLQNALNRFYRLGVKVARKARKREIARARKRRQDYDYAKALLEFNSLWLEARYGWRPLAYDVQSILKALSHKSEGLLSRRSHTMTIDISETNYDAKHFASNSTWNLTQKREGKCKIRAVVYYLDDMPALGANPLVTAWELTRFSFVIDWFIDIGSWIQAISPRVGFAGKGISVSVVRDYSDTYTTTVTGEAPWSYSMSTATSVRKYQRYDRWAYEDIVPLPSVQVNLNKWKVVDLIALAIQARHGVLSALRL